MLLLIMCVVTFGRQRNKKSHKFYVILFTVPQRKLDAVQQVNMVKQLKNHNTMLRTFIKEEHITYKNSPIGWFDTDLASLWTWAKSADFKQRM